MRSAKAVAVLIACVSYSSSEGSEPAHSTKPRQEIAAGPASDATLVPASAIADGVNNQYERALPAYREAVKREPHSAAAHRSLGLILLLTGSTEEAIKECNIATELDPTCTQCRKSLALCLLKAGKKIEAGLECDQIVERAFDAASAHYDIGSFYLRYHQYQEAICHFTAAISIKDTIQARLGRGIAFYRIGQDAAARDDYDTIINGDHNNHAAHSYRAYVNMRLGDFDAAARDASTALASGEQCAGLAYLVLGAVQAMSNPQLALQNLSKATDLMPDHPLPYIFRAQVRLLKTNEPELAIVDLDSAAAVAELDELNALLEGRAWQLFKLRGFAYLVYLQNNTAAIRDFTRSLELEKGDPDCYALRAWALMNAADWNKGRDDLESALAIKHDHLFALKLSALLLASCPIEHVRDGQKALDRAKLACAMTQWKNEDCIQALAAAKAEVGEFDDAILLQTTVLQSCDDSSSRVRYSFKLWWNSTFDFDAAVAKKDAEGLLNSYEQHKPYRLAAQRLFELDCTRTSFKTFPTQR